MSQEEAGEELKVSRRNVQRAKSVQEKGAPELAQAVVDGAISLGAASEMVALPHEEQREVVKKVKKGAKPSTVVAKQKAVPRRLPPLTPTQNQLAAQVLDRYADGNGAGSISSSTVSRRRKPMW